jgi:hypothetical protein
VTAVHDKAIELEVTVPRVRTAAPVGAATRVYVERAALATLVPAELVAVTVN